MNSDIQVFEEKNVRRIWDEQQEEWFFSIVDVVAVLSESTNPTDYLRKLRKRDAELATYLGTNCPQKPMRNINGIKRNVLAGTTRDILRLIQSIPSKKAEPFKIWLAEVGSTFLNETQDPELAIQRAMENYQNLGYSEEWINTRLQSIQFRKEYTDELKRTGVTKNGQFAALTNELLKGWSGKTAKEYRAFKGLKKQSLRDNMTSLELALNTLAETSATEISRRQNPHGYQAQKKIAQSGGEIARQARENIEDQTGTSVISPLNANQIAGRKSKSLKKGGAQ
ncbi:MAG: BRO family protein [bacterium]|nr:BRO family protein [bacterium]